MNARPAAAPTASWGARAVQALVRVRVATRVLLLATATLLGAVIYLVANWPGPEVPVVVSQLAPAAQARLPRLIQPDRPTSTINNPAPAAAAGSLIVHAARAVVAAREAPLAARTEPGPLASANAGSPRQTSPASEASVATARTSTGGPPSPSDAAEPAPSVSSQPRRLLPNTADAGTLPLPPSVGQGPNRIAVPTAAPPTSSPNRISVPSTQPPP